MEEEHQPPITTMDNFKICRICLNINKAPLEPSFHNTETLTLFSNLTNLIVVSNDGLPKMLCQFCNKKLLWFGEFRAQCLDSEKRLRLRLTKMMKYNVQTRKEADDCLGDVEDIMASQVPNRNGGGVHENVSVKTFSIAVPDNNTEIEIVTELENAARLEDLTKKIKKKEKYQKPEKIIEGRVKKLEKKLGLNVKKDRIKRASVKKSTRKRQISCDDPSSDNNGEFNHFDSSTDDDVPLNKRFKVSIPKPALEIMDPLQIKIEDDVEEEEIITKVEPKQEISELNENENIVIDSTGFRWRVCLICQQRFRLNNEASYARHMREHEICPVIKCLVCKKTFKSFSKLQCHEEMKHVGVQMKNISCLKCDNKFIRIGNLMEHFQSRHSEWCPKEKPKIIDESLVKSERFELLCRKCKHTSKNEKELRAHMRMHKVCPEIRCDECEIDFKLFEDLAEHENEVHADDDVCNYYCKRCKKSYKTMFLLLRHDESKCNSKKDKSKHFFECVNCFESFAHGSDLMEHYSADRGNTGTEQSMVCPNEHCSFLSYNECALVHHSKIHQFPKQTCQHCGKDFKTKRHYRRHLLIHSRGAPGRQSKSQDNTNQDETNMKTCSFCKKAKSLDVIVSHELDCVMQNGEPSTSNCGEDKEADDFDDKESDSEDEASPNNKQKRLKNSTTAKLKCDICRDTILTLDTYNKHMLHHTVLPDIKCWECDISFDKMIKLRFHERNAHSGKSMKNLHCNKCSQTFGEFQELELHFKTHETKRPHLGNTIPCENCGETFSTKLKLTNHISRLNGRLHDDQKSPPFVCDKPDCRYRSYTQCAFVYHQRVHDSPEFICSVCGMCLSSYNSLKTHELKHRIVPKPFFCTKCNTTIEGTTYSTHYTRIHSREQPRKSWWCDLCNKYLKIAKRLHMMVHSGIKPHVCTFCDKSFTIKSDLRDHMDKHTNEKRHQCQTCFKMFSRMQLRFHKKKCPVAMEAAAAQENMVQAAMNSQTLSQGDVDALHIELREHLVMQPLHPMHHLTQMQIVQQNMNERM